jgi:DNA-binding transcriptional LysR family regulator
VFLSKATALAGRFNQSASDLTAAQGFLDRQIGQTITDVNRLTSQIATLNGQVAQMQGLGKDPGTVQDQRDELIRQLSGLVNIAVTQTEHGLTLTTANGVPLVVANQSFALQSNANNSVLEHVYSAQGQDITSQIQGGQLGGWYFKDKGKLVTIRVRGNLDCNDGELLHRWASEGRGLAWRSTWEIQAELASGALVTVLDKYALADYDIRAVYPQQPHIPAKVRLFVEHLKQVFSTPGYWTS